MAKAPVVEEKDLRHVIKVAAAVSEFPERDTALLYVLYGTGAMLTELASLKVRDYLTEAGAVREETQWRAEIAYNQRPRPLFWVNTKVVSAVDAYLDARLQRGHGVTTRTAAYRWLDPDSPLFLRDDGQPYQLTKRVTRSGAISYSCDSLSQRVRKLHAQAGVEGANALAARRTFAVRLARKGFDLRHIAELLGHASLTATKRLVDEDPIRLGDIVAGVI
jgi:YD repeat-containing protein